MAAARAKVSASLHLTRSCKPLRVMVLGQAGVGKSALVVRFLTRRYIGEYDPTLEQLYTFHTVIDGESANLEILDTAGQPHERECPRLEANIRWADAFILMYSITDKCSYDECSRLKFLINYNKRRRKLSSSAKVEVPVVLVANKADQAADRMVSTSEGARRSSDIGCVAFHEISVREHIEEVHEVFSNVVRHCRALSRAAGSCGRLKRSSSDLPASSSGAESPARPISPGSLIETCRKLSFLGSRSLTGRSTPSPPPPGREGSEDGSEGTGEEEDGLQPFRGRACTDGTLLQRGRAAGRRWRLTSSSLSSSPAAASSSGTSPAALQQRLLERRMSISMRGSTSTAY